MHPICVAIHIASTSEGSGHTMCFHKLLNVAREAQNRYLLRNTRRTHMKRTLFLAIGALAFTVSGWAVAQEVDLGAQAGNAAGGVQADADINAQAPADAPRAG